MSFRNIGKAAILAMAAFTLSDHADLAPSSLTQVQEFEPKQSLVQQKILGLLAQGQALLDRRAGQQSIKADNFFCAFGQSYQRACQDAEDFRQACSIAEQLIQEFNGMDQQEQLRLLNFVRRDLASTPLAAKEKSYLDEHIAGLIAKVGDKFDLNDLIFLGSLSTEASYSLLVSSQFYFGQGSPSSRNVILARLHVSR